MKEEYAQFLLNKIKEDYNKIANHFSRTRSYIPEDFLYLKKFIKKGERILDLGCGNGRLFEIKNDAEYFGVDTSSKMIEIAKKSYPQGKFFVTSPLSLPFQDQFFNKVFCLSVFHHIPSFKYRMQFLKKKTKWLLLKYTILKLIGKSKLDFFDIFLPWKDSQGNIIIQRYLHVFTLNSLKNTIQKAGFKVLEARILKRSKKESNLFVVAAPL